LAAFPGQDLSRSLGHSVAGLAVHDELDKFSLPQFVQLVALVGVALKDNAAGAADVVNLHFLGAGRRLFSE
jgi:hypothetical protein